MSGKLRHAIVLLISDDRACGVEFEAVLSTLGCIAHRAEPGRILDRGQRYDAAVLVTRQNSSWCSIMLRALRSTEFACACLVVLGAGDPEAIAETLRSGAVDCLVSPVSEPELTDSLVAVVESTRRWRARFSRARLMASSACVVGLEPCTATRDSRPASRRASAPAQVFEPIEELAAAATASVEVHDDDAKIEEVVERVSEQSGLTRRERQVLYWLLLGHRYADIALVLGVAPRTAKFHAANLLGKLELDSRYDLSRLLAEELERGD